MNCIKSQGEISYAHYYQRKSRNCYCLNNSCSVISSIMINVIIWAKLTVNWSVRYSIINQVFLHSFEQSAIIKQTENNPKTKWDFKRDCAQILLCAPVLDITLSLTYPHPPQTSKKSAEISHFEVMTLHLSFFCLSQLGTNVCIHVVSHNPWQSLLRNSRLGAFRIK